MAGLCHLAKDLLEGWQHAYAAHEVQQVCVGQQGSLTCRGRVRIVRVRGNSRKPQITVPGLLSLPPGVLA